MSEWRPIETAPANEWILVWAKTHGVLAQLPAIAEFHEDTGLWYEPDQDPYEEGVGPDEWALRWWMPLPPPPEAE